MASHDPALTAGLVQHASQAGRVVTATTCFEARQLVMRPFAWSAFLLQVDLPDATGFAFLTHARATHRRAPALLLSARAVAAEVEAAYDLDASYLVTPVASTRIRRFVLSATALGRVGEAVKRWERRYGLSAAEADVLARAADGSTQDIIAIDRGSSRLTVKKQVSNLLTKTADESLQAAAVRLLRDALDPQPASYSERSIVQSALVDS
ncbi:MAG TPA: hypothetical protein VHV30_05015 [Polyangiaceae bacterium]|nr:hypothetical protein [Polyangiaceae bacterium]